MTAPAPLPGPVSGRPHWTADDWRAFVAAHPGKGPAALGRLCGKTHATVTLAAQRHGLDLPDERRGGAHAERMRRRHAAGKIHPHLAHLTPPQRDAYRAARKIGCTQDEALREAERTPA